MCCRIRTSPEGGVFCITEKAFSVFPRDTKMFRKDAHANAEEIGRLKATRLRRRIRQSRILIRFLVCVFPVVWYNGWQGEYMYEG